MNWKFILVVVVLIVGAIGYYLWNQTPDVPKDATFKGYTQTLQRDEQKAQIAASDANVKLVQDAIEKYKTMKGSSPSSLQDLVPDYLDHIPGGIKYDPGTGLASAVQ